MNTTKKCLPTITKNCTWVFTEATAPCQRHKQDQDRPNFSMEWSGEHKVPNIAKELLRTDN